MVYWTLVPRYMIKHIALSLKMFENSKPDPALGQTSKLSPPLPLQSRASRTHGLLNRKSMPLAHLGQWNVRATPTSTNTPTTWPPTAQNTQPDFFLLSAWCWLVEGRMGCCLWSKSMERHIFKTGTCGPPEARLDYHWRPGSRRVTCDEQARLLFP